MVIYVFVCSCNVGGVFIFIFIFGMYHNSHFPQCFFKFIILMAISTDAQSINILDFNVLNNIH